MDLVAAIRAESLKVRRSNVPVLSAVAISLAPLVGALFMLVLRDPDWARRTGLLSTKAQLAAGTADWLSYSDLLEQATAIGGLVIFSIVVIWIFGREFEQATVTDLLAVPVTREMVVLSKFIVAAVWSLLLVVLLGVLGLVLGMMLALPGGSTELLRSVAATLAVLGVLTVVLAMPFGWIVSATRGYLPAVGALFLLIFVSQVIAALGWGDVFPWTVPALLAHLAGPTSAVPDGTGYLLVFAAGAAGILATAGWWRLADQR
jgi:ABC-2 type transport system permease protein